MLKRRYALRNLLNCTVRDFKTKKELFRIENATAVENSWTANETPIRGGDGLPILATIHDSKDSELKISTQVMELDYIAMMDGTQITEGSQKIEKTEVLTVQEDTGVFFVTINRAIAKWEGTGTVTEEDVRVRQSINGGVLGDDVTVDAVTTTTVGSVTTTKVELTGVTAGEEVRVFYKWMTSNTALMLEVTSDGYPDAVEIVGDGLLIDIDTNEMVAAHLTYPKLMVSPARTDNFNPTGDATTWEMTFKAMPVKINGVNVMRKMVIYEDA